MKVAQIISVVETYYQHKNKLQKDIADYQDYKIFDNDDVNAERMKKAIEMDKKVLGQFLDMEV